jgi:hypothetical protein
VVGSVFEHQVNEVGNHDRRRSPRRGQLPAFEDRCFPQPISLDGGPFAADLLPLLLSVFVVIDPPDSRTRRTFENSRADSSFSSCLSFFPHIS